ncbi:HAD family hydrolase [Demequina oxidasica]|uniref:HAD family hydrolase n=1 Tax=Demequina oxidasica TaxID=676199 RepID=UPI001F23EB80|nr:HAD family hydrolase [Demequina oxidasica]
MSQAAINAVLFDVDDTLVDTKGAFRHALTTVAAEYLAADAELADVAVFWRADRHGHYRAHTRGEMDHREQRMRRANDLHAEFGGVLMGDDAYDAWDVVFEQGFQDGWRAFDDAHACLDALEEAGIPYGALSNARFDYQNLKLAAVGLERVPMLVGVDTLGFGKPDPRVFALAAERLGSAPAQTAYIGDELDIDAIAATRAGLSGYWLDRSRGADAGTGEGGSTDDSVVTQDGLTVPRVATLREFSASIGPH